MVDCVSENQGCQGGWPVNAFKVVKNQDGIATERSYPYKSGVTEKADESCMFKKKNIGAKITGWVAIKSYDTEAILDVVGNVGPVVALLDDTSLRFQFYGGGIYNNPNCVNSGPNSTTHAMLIVGYVRFQTIYKIITVNVHVF